MATPTGRTVRATIVKQDKVDQAMSFLKELPDKPKEDLSLREAVGHLNDSIKDALAKGYSYTDLAKMLTEQGIKISALTLKNYVPSGKRSAAKTRTRKPRKTQGEEEGATSTSTPEAQPEASTPARRPRRKVKSEPVETNASTPATEVGASTPPKRSTRGRTKSAAAAKSRTGSRTRAKKAPDAPTADSTAAAPAKSRRRRTSA